MNVGELIEKLKELNPNLLVYFGVSDTWFWSADCLEVCDPDNFGEDVCLIYHQVVEMNVRELIERLQMHDQESIVRTEHEGEYCGAHIFDIIVRNDEDFGKFIMII